MKMFYNNKDKEKEKTKKPNKKETDVKEKKHGIFYKLMLIKPIFKILILAVIAVLVVFGLKQLGLFGGNKVKTTIVTSSDLEQVLLSSDLSTYKTTYNGVACEYKDGSANKVSYYVSYEGWVKIGINMEDVDIDVEEAASEGSNRKVIVTLPKLKVTDFYVDMASLEYMFIKNSSNTGDVSKKAYDLCIADLVEASSENSEMFTLARENTINVINALISPILENQDEKYDLEIN